MTDYKEDIEALKETISIRQEELLNELLLLAEIEELDEETYKLMLNKIKSFSKDTLKIFKALESHEIIDFVMTNKLK